MGYLVPPIQASFVQLTISKSIKLIIIIILFLHFNCLHAGQLFVLLFASSAYFFKINVFKEHYSLDLDQDRRSISTVLGPECLQRLSADDKSGF